MIPVELTKVIIDEKRQDQIIVLKEKNSDRHFPIIIGPVEASSIQMKLSGVETPRPMSHDLLISLVKSLDASLEKIVVDKMIGSIFHAKLYLKTKDGEEKIVDARPSDSIALAVRLNTPIFVEEAVIEKAAIYKPE